MSKVSVVLEVLTLTSNVKWGKICNFGLFCLSYFVLFYFYLKPWDSHSLLLSMASS